MPYIDLSRKRFAEIQVLTAVYHYCVSTVNAFCLILEGLGNIVGLVTLRSYPILECVFGLVFVHLCPMWIHKRVSDLLLLA